MTRYYLSDTGQMYAIFDEDMQPPRDYEDITDSWVLGQRMLQLLYGVSNKTYRYVGYMEFLGKKFANIMVDGTVVQPARRARGRPPKM